MGSLKINQIKRKQILSILFVLLPFILLAGSGSDDGHVEFFEGDGALERWFMDVFARIDMNVWDEANGIKRFGQAIGAIGAMIYLMYLGIGMSQGNSWDITPLIRPLVIGLILANWVNFVKLIQLPFEMASNPSIALYENIAEEAEERRTVRFNKQNELYDASIKMLAKEKARLKETERLAQNTDALSSVGDAVVDAITPSLVELTAPIEEFMMRTEFKFQKLVAETIDYISLWILRICVYFIFILSKVWGYILITLGPIAIGMSLIPGFENSLSAWIAKFININLYTFIAYQVINVGQIMIIGAYDMEVDRMSQILGEGDIAIEAGKLASYVTNAGFLSTIGMTCVAYGVTAVAILMVPSIADSIVSAGGAGIMSKAKAGAGTVSGGARKVGGGAMKAANAAGGAGASALLKAAQLLSGKK